MTAHDRTFEQTSAYGSERWCAATVGISYDQWRTKKRKALELDGFPKRDNLIGLTLKADVLAWIENRRRVRQIVGAGATASESKVNRNAL